MPKKISAAIMDAFVSQMNAEGTLHFPRLAKQVGVDWHDDMLPALRKDPALRQTLKNAIDNLRYEMLDNLYKGARDGKNPHKMIDASMINAMLKVFKAGVVDELAEEEKAEGEIDQEAIKKHLDRLGLKNEQ